MRGFDMALREADEGRAVLVILLSDGVANVGATRTDDLLEQIGERGDIGLTTIGVGPGPFNDELMEQLSNKADGTHHYIDTVDEARRIFVENLTSLLASVARDAKIQVEFDRRDGLSVVAGRRHIVRSHYCRRRPQREMAWHGTSREAPKEDSTQPE